MKVAALLLSVLLGCAAVAAPCFCVCLASLRRQARGEAIPAFSLGPLFLLRPHLSLPSSGTRGGQAQGAHHSGEEMGRYYALRWGPKGRTILRSLNALHAILQDLEGSSSSGSSSSSSGSDGPLSDCWQVAAYPSLEEAETWLDQQDEVQQQDSRAKRRLVAAEGGDIAAVSVQPSEGEKPTGRKSKAEIVTAFADGACPANGKAEARAGIGVYFGPGDPRNVSLPLSEGPQTNQRAELAAILAALHSFAYADDTAAAAATAAAVAGDRHSSVCPKQQGETGKRQRQEEGEETELELHLHCDSNYAVQCVGPWADRWEANGWKTAAGTSVSNADLIKTIRRLMRQRRETPPSGARWRGRVRFFLVRGHSGVQGNEAADALAVRGAQMHAALREQEETGKQQDTKETLLQQHILQALRAACSGTHRAA